MIKEEVDKMKLIINADDFGASNNINLAIKKAFKENLISSATIMSNMPGFEEACKIIHDENFHGKIGIHLNLTAGKAITKEMQANRRFCNEFGSFKPMRQTLFYLSNEEEKLIYNEFEAQLNRLIENNIIPTHIDSHHHYHTEWAISKSVLKLAKNNDINAVRLTRNLGSNIKGIKKIYKYFFNFIFNVKGLAKVRHFGSINDILTSPNSCLNNVEIMVHPKFNKKGELIDYKDKQLCLEVQKVLKNLPKHKLSTY